MKRLLCTVSLLTLAACGSSSSSSSSSATACTSSNAVATQSVLLTGYAFSPDCIKVASGNTVTFTNQDATTHTVTASGSQVQTFDSGNLTQNQNYTQTFTAAGNVNVHCSIHPYMTATIIVQ